VHQLCNPVLAAAISAAAPGPAILRLALGHRDIICGSRCWRPHRKNRH